MRMVISIALGAVLVLSSAASAGVAECRRLERQIEHFEGMVDRARELDNEMWEERTQQHVDRLKERAKARCPEYADDDSAARAFANLLRLAGKAALTYFTFGAL